ILLAEKKNSIVTQSSVCYRSGVKSGRGLLFLRRARPARRRPAMVPNPRHIRRLLLVAATAAFIYIQVRHFSAQSHDAGRLALAGADQPDLSVAAVVIMACNRPDYLHRTVESILKYQKAVASKFPLFISQDGTNGEVKNKALSYTQITFMQTTTNGPWTSYSLSVIFVE
uniref:Alpha-1,3-mannosyl-glycoprotein 2-beta-N-acetylglucosaminyltransferase n=1 Tax=Aegilops tauschii subsp. strangulata TaxID=200361 RepID=A0A453GM94_AEGTS